MNEDMEKERNIFNTSSLRWVSIHVAPPSSAVDLGSVPRLLGTMHARMYGVYACIYSVRTASDE